MKSLFALLLVSASAFGVNNRYIRIPNRLVTPEFVQRTDFNRDHKRDDTYAFGYVPMNRVLTTLEQKDAVDLDAWEWATHDHDAKTLLRVPSRVATSESYEDFHTYDTLTTELKSLVKSYPKLTTLESVGKTVDGRDLWLLRITSDKNVGPKPKLLYVSSMHGDEVTGKEMMIYLVRDLLKDYGTDARLTALVDNAEIFVMPSMNPDGTQRRQRENAKNIDLNRDFPRLDQAAFDMTGRAPETTALMELYRKHEFALAMNFHGGSLVVNIPWDSRPNTEKFGDDAIAMSLARGYADHNEPMAQNTQGSFDRGVTYGWEWYEVLGGMQDWSIFFRESLHETLEISNTKWPQANQLPTFWRQNKESMVGYLEGGMTGVHLSVTDDDGNFLPITVDVDSATNRPVHYQGFVHRPTIAGSRTVTVKSQGYSPQTITVDAAKFDGEFTRVVMKK